MAGYNFKNFFRDKKIHNSEYVSNAHFIIKRSLLTKKQNEFVDTFELNEQLAKTVVNALYGVIKRESDMEVKQYIPEFINTNFIASNSEKYNIVINKSEIAIKEEYYNFFKSLKCKLYYDTKASNYSPVIIYDEENNIVGLVCSVKVSPEAINNAIDYNNYIAEQKQIAKQNKNNIIGKCIHADGIQRKQMVFLKEIDGYRFYAIKNATQDYDYSYIQINEYVYPICSISRIDNAVQEIKDRNINLLKWIEDDFNNRLSNKMQSVSIGVAEMLGRREEAIDHNRKLYEIRKAENEQREKEKQKENDEFVKEHNKIAFNKITEAKQAIINKEKVNNIQITIYKSKYEYNNISIILQMMKMYDINVPLKTQGWINNALANIFYDTKNNEYSYAYYSSSKNSEVFRKYLNELVNKIK